MRVNLIYKYFGNSWSERKRAGGLARRGGQVKEQEREGLSDARRAPTAVHCRKMTRPPTEVGAGDSKWHQLTGTRTMGTRGDVLTSHIFKCKAERSLRGEIGMGD